MVEEFDKEIDVLLRQAAQGEIAFEESGFKIQDSGLPHLNADEISLFAENALPKRSRENALAHFADCDRCRKILSDLISQNPENEVVSDSETDVFAPAIPWYRKFFVFPNLAYTLGALVLVFSGLVAFTVLQSVDEPQNAELSQISEQPRGGPFTDETTIVQEQNTNTLMSGNSMSNSSRSNTAATSSPNMTSNSSANSTVRNSNANSTSNSSAVSNKSTVSENELSMDGISSEVTVTQQRVTELPLNGRNFSNLTAEKTESDKAKKQEQKEKKKAEETTDTSAAAPSPSVLENQVTSSGALRANARKKMRTMDGDETTSVSGKTFKRAGNGWVDSAYKGQATTNITRGTSEFKKLDSDLRRIAENLGGTVIIFWKDKAYRIQ